MGHFKLGGFFGGATKKASSAKMCLSEDSDADDGIFEDYAVSEACAVPQASFRSRCAFEHSAAPRLGRASAARVSRGTEEDTWRGLSVKEPQRHVSEHVTVTIVIYNAIADGVPSSDDVMAAIDDLEALYASCSIEGRLADPSFDFMKGELTAKDAADIKMKGVTRPCRPPPAAVVNHDVFPSC